MPEIPETITKTDRSNGKTEEVPIGDIKNYTVRLGITFSPPIETGFSLSGAIFASDIVQVLLNN